MSTEPTCPNCEHTDIVVDLACHTWPFAGEGGTVRWMSCQGCDSALGYYCHCWLNDEVEVNGKWEYREPPCKCGWSYIHGLNPDNPSKEHNEKQRPAWLEPELQWSDSDQPIKHPGIRLAR